MNLQLLSNCQLSVFLLFGRFLFIEGGSTGLISGRLRPTRRCFGLRLSTDDERGAGSNKKRSFSQSVLFGKVLLGGFLR